MRRLLFTIRESDFHWQTFRAGGKGGQHQNKVETGVRCIHEPSGARAEARDSRSQRGNKVAAFKRLVATKSFQHWHRLETARILANAASINAYINAAIEADLDPSKIKVEVRDTSGQWTAETNLGPIV